MSYVVTNITNTTGPISPTPDGYYTGQILYVGDIPNVSVISWTPGQAIDLDLITTRTQIFESRHLRVHINEGRMTVVASADPGSDVVLK